MRPSPNRKANVLLGLCLVVAVCLLPGCRPGRSYRSVPIEKPDLSTVVHGLDNRPIENEYIVHSVVEGKSRVVDFFKDPFPHDFSVCLFDHRGDLDSFWRYWWELPAFRSECWMVASATQDLLVILTPKVWRDEACEHDPENEEHVQNLITHELVHVYHDQHNPEYGFEGFHAISWFVEGLATYVSGQLDEGYLASPVEAIRLGLDPEWLSEAWSGKYRYGVCGSLVKYLKSRGGKGLLKRLLPATTPEEIFTEIGMSEGELLKQWRAWLLKNADDWD